MRPKAGAEQQPHRVKTRGKRVQGTTPCRAPPTKRLWCVVGGVKRAGEPATRLKKLRLLESAETTGVPCSGASSKQSEQGQRLQKEMIREQGSQDKEEGGM